MRPRFLLVTPAHNEAAEAASLVAAVRASELQPDDWVIVDDNSDDGTGDAFARAGSDLPYLRVHRIQPEGEYMAFRYSEVVAAGLALARPTGDCIVGILDADIRFGPSYWQRLWERLRDDPRLGIASGALCAEDSDGRWRFEAGQYRDLPRGGLRLIRGACLADTGGIARARSPDTIMSVRARLRGWKTILYDDIVAYSTRPTGTRADYKDVAKSYGQRQWDLGRPAWFPIYKALDYVRRGEASRAAGLLQGYFGEWVEGTPRAADAAVRRYYRWEPMRRRWLKLRAAARGGSSPAASVPRREVDRSELER